MVVGAFNPSGSIARLVEQFKEDLLKELRAQENNYAQIIKRDVLREVKSGENRILKSLEKLQLDKRNADNIMKFLKLFSALDKNSKLANNPDRLSEMLGLNIEYVRILVNVWKYGRIYERIKSMKSFIVDMIAAERFSIQESEPNKVTRKYF